MSPTESTPLVSGQGARGALKDVNQFVSNLFTKENLANAGSAAKEQLQNLQRSASDGDFSIRLLALVSGLALVISAGFGFVGLVLKFHITSAILEIYTFILGVIMLALEIRGHLRSHTAQQQQGQASRMDQMFRTLFKYALFLRFVWGRGLLYFVAGSLQLAQGSLTDFAIGGFVMFVGILYIMVGHRTAQKLTQLRQSLSEHTLQSKFHEADTDGNGKLSLENFKVLTESLGMTLSRREREVAFLCMDRTDSGAVSFEDFQAWWSDWEEGSEVM